MMQAVPALQCIFEELTLLVYAFRSQSKVFEKR
jgi:hypothetical protein